jgi:hypothetical protein
VAIEWSRVTFTEHVTEAAALVAECAVALDFGAVVRVQYEVKVYEALKGGGADRYFALGTNRADPEGFRPLGGGETPEAALQACLNAAGVHHRRHVKQAGG